MGAIPTNRGLIDVADVGGGERTPLLFLHGVGSERSVWEPQLAHFGDQRRAIALSYPGYGGSALIANASRDDYAAAVIATLDALEIERAHICGLSLGGVVAIAIHAAAPARCRSLIIADSFAVHPDGRQIYDRSVGAARTIGMRALAESRAGILFGQAAGPALHRAVIETMSSIDREAYLIGARAVWLADQRDRAAAITVPTLVLVGDEDVITPPILSEQLAALIPRAELQVIAGAGHLANLEQPEAFNTAVDQFISVID